MKKIILAIAAIAAMALALTGCQKGESANPYILLADKDCSFARNSDAALNFIGGNAMIYDIQELNGVLLTKSEALLHARLCMEKANTALKAQPDDEQLTYIMICISSSLKDQGNEKWEDEKYLAEQAARVIADYRKAVESKAYNEITYMVMGVYGTVVGEYTGTLQ